MASTFPTSLDTIPDTAGAPALGGSTPKHSEVHNTLRDAIVALETTVGITGSADAASVEYRLTTHAGSTSNPHSVTKSQVGLGSADNTADSAKPVSTLQAAADTAIGVAAAADATAKASAAQAAAIAACPAETTTTTGSLIAGATAKTAPADADLIGISDSAASNVLKKLAWSDAKAAMSDAFEIATAPKLLWASGQIFWLPPGDGGANGLLFAGGGTGAFTLSAAVPAGFSVPQLWIYLTANAGGSGNPAGWHYATMSSDVAGIVYADRYDSTSGVVPVFPASPATLNCTSATRLTTTVTDIQMFQVPVNFATQMGLNGLMEMAFKTFGNNAASNKFLSLRAGTNLLYQNIPTTSPVMDWGVAVSACGSLSKQLITRQSTSVGAAAVATISNDFRSVNLAAETTLNVGIKLTAVTDSLAVAVRKLSMIYGG